MAACEVAGIEFAETIEVEKVRGHLGFAPIAGQEEKADLVLGAVSEALGYSDPAYYIDASGFDKKTVRARIAALRASRTPRRSPSR